MLHRTVVCLLALGITLLIFSITGTEAGARHVTQGSLQVIDKAGNFKSLCPLKHTDVKATISGSLSRVTVTQEFTNPFKETIEAIYVFPLPSQAAVDDMTIAIGERKVKGLIKKREEARAIYEAARDRGMIAALLDQERPNIFTQSVANIVPGASIKVEIGYVEQLEFEDGTYEFVFPMVVGPRYIPRPDAEGQSVSDASNISPPVAPELTRAGHDIDINVSIDAGAVIEHLESPSHDIEMTQASKNQAQVSLKDKETIPNKDFRLKLDVTGQKIKDAFLVHRDERGGFFELILQPPDRVDAKDLTPRELVFVLDTSGSMSGFPIEKAKETMKLALNALNPMDTFNLITFSGDTAILFPEPVPATVENLRRAQEFLASRQGRGGTEMMKAIRAALDPSDSQEHMRIVCFMTDGYVGNDLEIIAEVQRHPNARVFSFGIGGSVNRFLLDGMAAAGRGDVEYVALTDDGSRAASRFHERVRNPVLTDISIDWGGLPVGDVYPKRIPDLFSAKPVVMTGRFSGAAKGTIRLSGRVRGQFYEREIPVVFPETETANDVIATLWARTKVGSLLSEDYLCIQRGNPKPEIREAITALGLDYRLMTQFTSFVAVEEAVVTDGGKPRRIQVPVEMPEGVRHNAEFGQQGQQGGPLIVRHQGIGGKAGNLSMAPSMPISSPAPMTETVTVTSTSTAQTKDSSQETAALTKLDSDLAQKLKSRAKGQVEVQIWLTEKTPAVVAELKRLGVTILIDAKGSRLVIGRVAIEKLKAVAELKSVRMVTLQK
jgi:Ca-activated chloride channel family protein